MTKTCKTCGHDVLLHLNYMWHCKDCPCKKFVAENDKVPDKVVNDFIRKGLKKLEKPQKKGCGNIFMHKGMPFTCRFPKLCPSCSGNHTPTVTGLVHDLKKEKGDCMDKPLLSRREKTSAEDFDLSEKIDEYGVPSGGKVVYVKDIKTFIKINKMHSSNAEFYNPREKVIPLRVFIKLCGKGLSGR